MRQLKFRQPIYHWDGSFREWHYWGLFESDGEWVNIAPASRNYMADVRITDPLDSTQFTGLTDKNGVEIYEGDIVLDGEKTREVKWNSQNASFYLSRSDGKLHSYKEFIECGQSQSDGPVCCDTIEVIGNIYEQKNYEHPHLIKRPA